MDDLKVSKEDDMATCLGNSSNGGSSQGKKNVYMQEGSTKF